MEAGSEDSHAALMKELEAAMRKAAVSKGQLVTDHPNPEVLAEAFRQETARHNGTPEKKPIYVIEIQDLHEPCLIPEKDLEPMSISDMRLQTHHRGKKVLLWVKTALARAAAVVTIVEDEEGTAVLLALHQQLEEDLSAVRHPAQDSVAVLKNPFFDKIAEGTYSLQVYHPSDIIWLEHHDERIPSSGESTRRSRVAKNIMPREQSSRKRSTGCTHYTREFLHDLHANTLTSNTTKIQLGY